MDREKAPWTSGPGELWGHRRPQILPPPLHPTRISDGPRKGVARTGPCPPSSHPKGEQPSPGRPESPSPLPRAARWAAGLRNPALRFPPALTMSAATLGPAWHRRSHRG